MAKRDNHYEAAFEAWLRWQSVPYVAVDESQRTVLRGRTLKSLDFIVTPPASDARTSARTVQWLIDVKGRQFPTARRQFWRNWSTRDELESLAGWEELLGAQALALLVFAYVVVGDCAPLPANELFVHRQKLYGFVGVRLDHYTSFARTLSVRWNTVTVPTSEFRAVARPVRQFFNLPLAAANPGLAS
jgi:hypothetical protein